MLINRRLFRHQVMLLMLLGSLLALSSAPAMAETYVAGMAGITVPQPSGISDGGVAAPHDIRASNSIMYGAKVGHYLSSIPWLGVEAEIFNTTPHIKPDSAIGLDQGLHNRVLSLAANAMLRIPGETLQPYVGVGPALMFSRISTKDDVGNSISDNASTVGVNALAGVRYLVTKQIVVFVEAKYQHAKFNYANDNIGDVKANYNVFHGAFGVGFQF